MGGRGRWAAAARARARAAAARAGGRPPRGSGLQHISDQALRSAQAPLSRRLATPHRRSCPASPPRTWSRCRSGPGGRPAPAAAGSGGPRWPPPRRAGCGTRGCGRRCGARAGARARVRWRLGAAGRLGSIRPPRPWHGTRCAPCPSQPSTCHMPSPSPAQPAPDAGVVAVDDQGALALHVAPVAHLALAAAQVLGGLAAAAAAAAGWGSGRERWAVAARGAEARAEAPAVPRAHAARRGHARKAPDAESGRPRRGAHLGLLHVGQRAHRLEQRQRRLGLGDGLCPAWGTVGRGLFRGDAAGCRARAAARGSQPLHRAGPTHAARRPGSARLQPPGRPASPAPAQLRGAQPRAHRRRRRRRRAPRAPARCGGRAP